MGWSIGFDEERSRDIGYGVPANCDHAGCTAKIDRGLGYVCGGEPFGGEYGCGLFICGMHTQTNKHCSQLCQHCADRRHKKLTPSADLPEWIEWKMTDTSWQQWRNENPEAVEKWLAAQQPVRNDNLEPIRQGLRRAITASREANHDPDLS